MLLQVFSKDGQLYAFKGLAGRLGPIGVHVALLMCIFGTGYSGFGGWKGTVMCPESGEFVVGNVLYPTSRISMLPGGAKTVMQVSIWCEHLFPTICKTSESLFLTGQHGITP